MFSQIKKLLSLSEVKVDMKNNAFDFVRLIAAIMVVFGHSGYLYGSKEIGWEAKYFDNMHSGTLAVWIFFAVSGFLVTRSWHRSEGIVDFILKRAKRIYPGFWVALFLSGTLFVPLWYYIKQGTLDNFLEVNGLDLWKFLTVSLDGEIHSQSVGKVAIDMVNGPLWTIHHELRAYLALGVIGLAGMLTASKKWFVLIVAIFFQIVRACYSYIPEFKDFYNSWFGDERILMFLAIFFWGVAISQYFSKNTINLSAFSISILLILLGTKFDFLPLVFPFCFAYSIISLCFLTPFKNISKKIGDLSYGIYLYHWPVRLTLQMLGVQEMGMWWLFGLDLICTVPFALLSWNLIEKRFLTRHQNLQTLQVKI